jgi:hypothetical protein
LTNFKSDQFQDFPSRFFSKTLSPDVLNFILDHRTVAKAKAKKRNMIYNLILSIIKKIKNPIQISAFPNPSSFPKRFPQPNLFYESILQFDQSLAFESFKPLFSCLLKTLLAPPLLGIFHIN